MIKHVKKNWLLYKDSLIATVLVYVVAIGLKNVPFNSHLFDPISSSLEDFEFSDLLYSRFQSPTKVDTNIIIVDVANLNREEIGKVIQRVKAFEPGVIGLDLIFQHSTGQDSLLVSSLDQDIVYACYLEGFEDDLKCFGKAITTGITNEKRIEGFTNFVAGPASTVRTFKPQTCYNGDSLLAFPVSIAKQFNIDAYKALGLRDAPLEIINYTGGQKSYSTLTSPEALSMNLEFVKGKIVLIGLLSPDYGTPVFEDLHFTPLNKKYSGKTFPDAYGVVIHANVISMILEEEYINKSGWIQYVLAMLIGLIHMVLFTHYFANHERHMWYHLIAKLAQLVTSVLFIFLSLILLAKMNYKLDVTLTVFVIALSIDFLYFYEAWAKFLNVKFGYKTIHSNE